RISHLNGDLWVDMYMETAVHNELKFAVTWTWQALNREARLGKVYIDRMRLTHPEAGLSTEPDGIFFTREALERQLVQLVRGEQSLEIVGSPEVVLEVISHTSVKKDTKILPPLYWKAGVMEYWLVDSRNKEPRFTLFRRGPKGFAATRKQDGWQKSQ